MKYTVIGHDGRTYGPVSAEQLRQWIQQKRVDSRTMVYVEGTADWTFAGLLVEFATDFGPGAGAPPVFTAGPATPRAVPAGSSSLAVWGFICGLLSWTCCCGCFPLGLLGLVFSIIALVEINASNGALGGRGFAVAGIILSAVNLLGSALMTLFSFLNDSTPFQWHIRNITIN